MKIVHDLVDPEDSQKRTYKEVNAEKTHKIPIGALVETYNGLRAYVVKQGRDCDMTPLYWISLDKTSLEEGDEYDILTKLKWDGGYSEANLTRIN